jgi:hypothetical protein
MRNIFRTASIALAFATWMASPASAWWAIAYGKGQGNSWAAGYSYNYPSAGAAAARALSECRENSDDKGIDAACQIVHQGTGSCVALAVQTEGNGWGLAWGDLDQGHSAVSACVRRNPGTECEVRSSFCESVDTEEASDGGVDVPSFNVPSFNAPISPRAAPTPAPTYRPSPAPTYRPSPAPAPTYRTPVNPCTGGHACAVQ